MRNITSPFDGGIRSPFGAGRRGSPPLDLFALTSDDDEEILVGDDGEALAVMKETIETVEALWS